MAYTGQDLIDYQAGDYFLPPRKYQLPYEKLPTTEEEEVTQGSGIPYTGAFTGGGGNNYTGSTQNLIGDFNTAITDRQAKINEMNRPMRPERRTANYNQPGQGLFTPAEQPTFKRRISDAFHNITGINKPQSYEDIMDKGYQEPGGMVMPGIIGLMNKFGIQNFAGLPQADQAFIASQSGYTGPTVFGDQGGMGHSVDPFGKNIESLAGNYAEYVSDRATKLKDIVADQMKRGLTNTIQMRQLKFYRGKKKEREGIESDLARRHQAEAAFAGRGGDKGAQAKQAAADKATVAQANRDYRDNPDRYSGGAHRADESGSTYTDPFDPGGGEKEGGFIDGSNRRAGLFYGGLAGIL